MDDVLVNVSEANGVDIRCVKCRRFNENSCDLWTAFRCLSSEDDVEFVEIDEKTDE